MNATVINTSAIYADALSLGGRYPLRDYPQTVSNPTTTARLLAGKWTGETRPPKAGEWYISGAIPECYRAPNDLTTPHAIARIVRCEIELVVTEYPFSG